jgi:hypothetical protein
MHMTAAKTKLRRILLYGLAGLTAFILVFLMSVFGVGLWQKKAKYPPPIDQTEARASLTLSGLAADRMGIALWQADGSGEEQKMAGHSLTTPRGEERARYYLSSLDYKDIDGFSTGGLKASEPVVGFMRLTAALQKKGFGSEDYISSLLSGERQSG